MNEPTPDCCGNSSRKMFSGILFLGLGILLLLQNLDIVDFSESWPAILIIIGLAMMTGIFGRKKSSRKSGEEAPGVYVKHDLSDVS